MHVGPVIDHNMMLNFINLEMWFPKWLMTHTGAGRDTISPVAIQTLAQNPSLQLIMADSFLMTHWLSTNAQTPAPYIIHGHIVYSEPNWETIFS